MKQVELEQTLKQRVEDVVKQYYNGSVNKFATALGIRQTTLNDQINGKSKISAAALLALLDVHPDISAEWLLRGTGDMLLNTATTRSRDGIETELNADVTELRDQLRRKDREIDGLYERIAELKRGTTPQTLSAMA